MVIMLYGLLESGERSLPQKGLKAVCPYCKGSLIPKCGKIRTHYWAHKALKDCPFSHEMTPWHYGWLENYDGLSSEGWKVEYFFNSVRFDAYHPQKKMALEFQRVVDLDYMENKIQVCSESGIRLMWLLNPEGFRNFIYTYYFVDEECHTVISDRRGTRKISLLLDPYMDNDSVTFSIDFTDPQNHPQQMLDWIKTEASLPCQRIQKHDNDALYRMPIGIYRILNSLKFSHHPYTERTVLKLKHYKSHFQKSRSKDADTSGLPIPRDRRSFDDFLREREGFFGC